MKSIRFITLFAAALILISGCSKIKQVQQITEKLSGDRLYFCERYVTKEIGEDTKFKAGKITIMIKLQNPIGEKEVDINVTDLATGKVVNTEPFTVQPSWDYIHFDEVEFSDKGKFKVSCLKKNGTVIVTGEVEII
jgi:hypothetical protein